MSDGGFASRIDAASIDGLKAGLRGPLLLPGNPGFDDARSVWNAMIDRRPAIIVRCLGAADVITCVNYAREQKMMLAIKGGGHNIAGLAVCDGGLMLDMSLMRGVWVDPAARTARAQAGCLLGDVDRETQVHGLAAVLGFVSNTGIAGLTLGGGFGYLTRRFGWTCDTVLSMDVVTADGRLVRASEKESPDLFWGLRGGGGNFGVVTSFEYRVFPIGPEVTAGVIAWRAEEAEGVLKMYREITDHASPELTCAAILRNAPPAPWLPKEIHGKPIVALIVCHTGDTKDGEREMAAVKRFGSPVGDVVQRRPYVSQQSIIDATQPKGRRYYWKSEYLPGLTPSFLSKMIEHSRSMVSPMSALIVMQLNGAIEKLPADYSPVGNRDTAFVLNIMASWEHASNDAANIAWTRAAWSDLRAFSTGGTYVNFMTEDEPEERIRDAYGKNYTRLAEIKTSWDPGNLFRMNKNISPPSA